MLETMEEKGQSGGRYGCSSLEDSTSVSRVQSGGGWDDTTGERVEGGPLEHVSRDR